MILTRKPAGPYLIESAPHYAKRRFCLRLLQLTVLPATIVCAAVSGYQNELHHMIDAQPIGDAE